MSRWVAMVALVAIGCGSEDAGQTTNQANPCATRGATYQAHFQEEANGQCGPVPDQILNISRDGTIAGTTVTCDEISQDGCTARNTGCVSRSGGTSCKATTSVTFAADGSSATGAETITCTAAGGQQCTSTYSVQFTRR